MTGRRFPAQRRRSHGLSRKSHRNGDLAHILTQLKQRVWVLSNPYNPSTKRLLAIEHTASPAQIGRHTLLAGNAGAAAVGFVIVLVV